MSKPKQDRRVNKVARVRMQERFEPTLLGGHPWIYRKQLSQTPDCDAGSWVEVTAGKVSAFALWDPDSPLALRVFSRERCPDEAWFHDRVAEAWAQRQDYLSSFGLVAGEKETNAFRWLNGEGDFIPGVIADYYAGIVVLVLDSPHYRRLLPYLLPALTAACPDLQSVVLKQRAGTANAPGARVGEVKGRLELLWGEWPSRTVLIKEYGLTFQVNVFEGQKTGLFLDHRENRRLVERYCAGKRVLNLFAYSGAFSLYAARAGAKEVVSVDVAPGAAQDALRNFEHNGMQDFPHEFVVADVFDFLEDCRKRGRLFDLVICDPPSFARNQAHLDKAVAAYERVNAAGLKVVESGGIYAAASCTARVSHDALTTALARAARRARRSLLVFQDTHHAPDHPVAVAHPEGRYLKFLLGRVRSRV